MDIKKYIKWAAIGLGGYVVLKLVSQPSPTNPVIPSTGHNPVAPPPGSNGYVPPGMLHPPPNGGVGPGAVPVTVPSTLAGLSATDAEKAVVKGGSSLDF